jgi:hypothetical protein
LVCYQHKRLEVDGTQQQQQQQQNLAASAAGRMAAAFVHKCNNLYKQ